MIKNKFLRYATHLLSRGALSLLPVPADTGGGRISHLLCFVRLRESPCADTRLQIPQQEQKKATRLVAVPSYALRYLGEVISANDDANKGGDANEDRIEVKLKTDTVYFFESLKNLAMVHRELCMDELSGFWDIVSEIPEYQADELIGHGIDIME